MYTKREKEELRVTPGFWCKQLRVVIVDMRKIRVEQVREESLESKFYMCKIWDVKSNDIWTVILSSYWIASYYVLSISELDQ